MVDFLLWKKPFLIYLIQSIFLAPNNIPVVIESFLISSHFEGLLNTVCKIRSVLQCSAWIIKICYIWLWFYGLMYFLKNYKDELIFPELFIIKINVQFLLLFLKNIKIPSKLFKKHSKITVIIISKVVWYFFCAWILSWQVLFKMLRLFSFGWFQPDDDW